MEPKKEPKKAALLPLLLLYFLSTGFNTCLRSRTRPASLAARCAKRTAEHIKIQQNRRPVLLDFYDDLILF